MRKLECRKSRTLTLLYMGFALALWAKPTIAQNINQLNIMVDKGWYALTEGQRLQDNGDLESAFRAYTDALYLTRSTLDMAKRLGVFQKTPSRVFYQAGHAHLGISEIFLQTDGNPEKIWQELEQARSAFETTLHFLYTKKSFINDKERRQKMSVAHFYLGIVSMNLGNFPMARRELEKSMDLGYRRAAEALSWIEPGFGQLQIPEDPPQNLSGSRLWKYVKAVAEIFLPKCGKLATLALEDIAKFDGH